ncbi:DUF2793 domain-containing protein [Bosea eneae]|uniref:DUF2793 domain-containing protein n=2 Tax=Bosea eneae TaxID=151454 RepID=A0ABW0IXT0_9HYPH
MSDTPRLGLPLLAAGQAQKHVTHNDALMRLDALVHLVVSSRTQTVPPASPGETISCRPAVPVSLPAIRTLSPSSRMARGVFSHHAPAGRRG